MAKKPPVIGAMGADHVAVAASWIPIGVDEIEQLDNSRRFADTAASWIDAKLYAWLKAYRGAPLTPRQLADWAGWSRRQAGYLLDTVESQRADWGERFGGDPPMRLYGVQTETQSGPAEVNNGDGLQDQVGRNWAASEPQVGRNWADRARSSSIQVQPQPQIQEKTADPNPPEKPKKKKAKVIASAEALDLWADLVALRHKHRPGAAASLSMDPKMGRDLDDALTWASAPQILHAYDWWMRSVDCEWYQTRRVDIDTFSRPRKLGGFVRSASEWDHATEQAEIRRVELERESCPF